METTSFESESSEPIRDGAEHEDASSDASS